MTFINSTPKESSQNTENEPKETLIPPDANQWGYDLYPDRSRQDTPINGKNFFSGKGRSNIDKIKCERKVYRCVKESPLVKLMMGALKASGCTFDIRRHISCEECAPTVSGGYDPIMNQVIVCQNTVKNEGLIQAVLAHEMIHMFDYCKNELDFKNLDHLACTEIRAANLAHCSFMSAFFNGDASPFYVKEAHQNCVKNKALSSVMAARDITKEEAMTAINRVFTRCYSDLEPIGRRIRRNSCDMDKAYQEGFYYGYM